MIRCNLISVLRIFTVILIISINIALLLIPNYFSTQGSLIVKFNLNGVITVSNIYSYSDYKKTCSSDLPEEICSDLDNLSAAGKILKAMLIADVFTISIYMLSFYIQNSYMRKISLLFNTNHEIPKRYIRRLSCGYYAKSIILLHPFLISIGACVWIGVGKLEKISSDISIKEGIILLILQCFFSLLTTAGYLWEISAAKRKNMKKARKGLKNKYSKNDNFKEIHKEKKEKRIENHKSFDTLIKSP